MRTSDRLTIQLGTLWLDPTPPRYRYFGLGVVAARDGSYSKYTQAEWHVPGKRKVLFPKVVVSAKRTRGTFTGKLEDGSTASGSLRC